MPVNVRWYVSNEIILVESDKVLTIAEIMQMSNTIVRLLNSATKRKVYSLVDLRRMETYPINAISIAQAVRGWFNHSKCGDLVFFGELGTVTKFVIEMVARVSPFPFKILPTQEAALEYIISQTPGLEAAIQSANGTEPPLS